MCLPRTGSNSLRRYIQSTNLDYKVYNEPFDPQLTVQLNNKLTWPIYSYKDVIHYDNLFIKGMFHNIPKDLEHLSIEEFYEKILKDFDKVIFLDRLNTNDLSISLTTAHITDNFHLAHGKNVNVVSYENGIPLSNTLTYILEKKEQIISLSNKFNVPIYYYEDLYSNKETMKNFIENVIGLNFNEIEYDLYLNNKNKYTLKVKSII